MRYKEEINNIMWAIKNSFDAYKKYGTEFTHIERLENLLERVELDGYKRGFQEAETLILRGVFNGNEKNG